MTGSKRSTSLELTEDGLRSRLPLRFISCLLAVSVPFISYLTYNDYGVFRFELTGIFLLFVAFASLFGIVASMRSPYLAAMSFGLIIVVFCDLAFVDLLKRDSLAVSLGLLTLIFSSACLAAWFLSKACWQALAAFLLVFLASTILFPERRAPVAASQPPANAEPGLSGLPPVIHLILDEHLGLDGFPPDIPESDAVRAEILAFYRRWGFRLYSQAFSEEFATKHSLRRLFAGQAGPENGWADTASPTATLKGLKALEAKGYRFVIAGIAHADICGTSGLTRLQCRNYEPLSINNLKEAPLLPFQKALLIGGNYLKQSTLYKLFLNGEILAARILRRFDLELPLLEVEAFSLSTLSSDRQLQQIRTEIAQIKPGEYQVHHLILPHFPYALKADCSPRDVRDWQNYDSLLSADFNSPSERREKYRLYLAQTQCLYQRLERLMQELRDQGRLERSVILFHGDHGSRITLKQPLNTALEELTTTDLVDSYATLFAVRSPGLTPALDRTLVSIQGLYAMLVSGDFGSAVESRIKAASERNPPQVNLRGTPEQRWVAMPEFGQEWYRAEDAFRSK